jgi:hypothetical protein
MADESTVATQHVDAAAMAGRWKRCRDVIGGTDSVKAARTEYLPALEGTKESDDAYDAYLTRALFYPAGERTVTGLAGMMFGKPPSMDGIPDTFKEHLDDVTLDGVSLLSFASTMANEVLTVGRVGALMEMPEGVATNVRPYWVMYLAEQIQNWRTERINGRQVVTMVVLAETTEEPVDEFAAVPTLRYRVLRLRQVENGKRVYTTQIYVRDTTNKEKEVWIAQAEITPVRKAQPLDFIPFVCIGTDGVTMNVSKPPLLDLCDVNLSHFRTAADREHGAHYTALPTAYTVGANIPEGAEPLAIGSGVVWHLPMGASADMLEFSGAGLESLTAIIEEKRLLMVSLGARMLETQKNAAEAAQTVRMRHAGERSALHVMAEALGLGLTWMIRWHLFWSGLEPAQADAAIIKLNPDTMDELTAEDVAQLVAAWQAGAISKKTLHYNLTWGEWTRPGVTFEEEETDIEEEEEAAGGPLDPPDPDAPPDPDDVPQDPDAEPGAVRQRRNPRTR